MKSKIIFKLFWIIVVIIGMLIIIMSGLSHLKTIHKEDMVNWKEYLFQVMLVILVLGFGLKYFINKCEELKEVLINILKTKTTKKIITKKKLNKLFFGDKCKSCKKGFMNIINYDNYECGLCHHKIKK